LLLLFAVLLPLQFAVLLLLFASACAHRVSHAHWADVCVGLVTILVGAAAEGFAARQQLHVRLNANHCLILHSTGSHSSR
jgi:hypothetical protein